MPNVDGGHYFLTVLAPVRIDTMIDPIVGRTRSHVHMLAQKLALLPTGRQTAASPADAWLSPFARNTFNHMARFAIVQNPNFNGRLSGNSLLSLLRGVNPLKPQPVDELSTPYLLFAADIDARGDSEEAALAAYADSLWSTMRADLAQIFEHCIGFAGVDTSAAFLAYLKRCQVETTLPFNDYWAYGMNPANTQLPLGPLKAAGALAAVAAAVLLLALLMDGFLTLFGIRTRLATLAAEVTGWGMVATPALIGLTALTAWTVYGWVMRRGAKPFPAAPGSDLPTILKALFLQQAFTQFAIEAQGLDDAVLLERFDAFVDAAQPTHSGPALAAGECHAPTLDFAR